VAFARACPLSTPAPPALPPKGKKEVKKNKSEAPHTVGKKSSSKQINKKYPHEVVPPIVAESRI
jgi:hypothetical protein